MLRYKLYRQNIPRVHTTLRQLPTLARSIYYMTSHPPVPFASFLFSPLRAISLPIVLEAKREELGFRRGGIVPVVKGGAALPLGPANERKDFEGDMEGLEEDPLAM